MIKKAYTVNELSKEIGIGRSKIYAEIAAGKLIARKIGKKTIFLNTDVEAYIAALPLAPVSQAHANLAQDQKSI